MKKTFFLILISITFSCSSIKFNNEFLTSSSPTLDIDFDEIKLKNWYNLDLEKDSIPGMSVERAYTELIKDIKPNKVIVAVIDAGIDINHEDLKDVIWLNKGEIPNNKIDDDNNGYIDDINGWNFLGESYDETLEITRLVRDKKTDNPQYKEALNTINLKVDEAKKDLDFYKPILENYKTASDIIKKYLKVESFEIVDIKNIDSKDIFVSRSKEFLLYSNSSELNK